MGDWGGWLCYEWSCAKRGFKGKVRYASAVASVLMFLFTAYAVLAVGKNRAELDNLMLWLPPAIFLVVLLILVAYGKNRAAYEDVCALREKNARLEEERRPKISWLDPIMWTEPKNTIGRAEIRICRVRIKNDSNAHIEGVSVKLISMVNNKNEDSRHEGEMFWLKGNQEEVIFDLNAGDSKDVELFFYAEVEQKEHVWMCYRPGRVGVPKAFCPHEMLIRASAKNTTPIEMKIKFYVDAAGILRADRTDLNRQASQSPPSSICDSPHPLSSRA